MWCLQLLGGEDNYVVTLKESHAKFTFNFAEVYWNSR
jgi:tRNA G37 N-methylase Trm5